MWDARRERVGCWFFVGATAVGKKTSPSFMGCHFCLSSTKVQHVERGTFFRYVHGCIEGSTIFYIVAVSLVYLKIYIKEILLFVAS